MIGLTIIQAVIYGGVVSWLCWWIHVRIVVRRRLHDEMQDHISRAAAGVIDAQRDEISRLNARDRGYSTGGYLASPYRTPILDPGAEPAPVDRQHKELREWRAAWIEPNEEFILKTDKILNDIEWARLTDAEQRVRTARERAEHAQMHRDNPGAIYGCCIQVGVASIGPGEEKPTYTFEKHDQGEAVIA